MEALVDRSHASGVGLPGRVVVAVRRDVPLALLDLVVVCAAYLIPLVLRFDGSVPHRYWHTFRLLLPIAAAVHLSMNFVFGLYGHMWRYASVLEARRVILAGAAAVAAFLAVEASASHVLHMPLSVVLFGATLSLLGFGAIRFQSRLFAFRRREATTAPIPVLIVGAGDGGSMLIKDILRHPSLHMRIAGLIDDNRRKLGRSLHGIRVLGARAEMPELIDRLRIEEVLLAIPSVTSDVVRAVAADCEDAHIPLRVLPSVRELVGHRVTVRDIRDLRIEDLLGRQQVQTDLEAVRSFIEGRRVLITGAGGSIGSEIAHQVLQYDPLSLVLLDHDETHLHDLLTEIDEDRQVESILADIRDTERLHRVFTRFRPEVVFHAAAHKHVDALESHPVEAVATNIIGTANVVDAAVAQGAGRFVLISSDKAVKPSSIMGASKWFAEQVVRSVHDRGAVFCAVRFGNVLGSRGSVIPTFFRQIARGGPVTVTDPHMARYFMSIHEAVQLVLQAAALSTGGEVFTLEMGEPMNIMDLAHRVIRLSGRIPGRDIPIRVVGRRPGEKIVEDLVDPDEEPLPTSHPGIVVARPRVPDPAALRRAIRELEALAEETDLDALAARMKKLAGEPMHAAVNAVAVATMAGALPVAMGAEAP